MPPDVSMIVPVRDGGAVFRRCLAAACRHRSAALELIVVDDGSRDGSAQAARAAGARVLSTAGGEGPAAARNLGAREASAPWLLFVDADCELAEETLPRLHRALEEDPGLDAAFGSYDDQPAAPGLVSQYKNLLHHWVHQQGAGEAETFWAGCGAVRRSAFQAVGGFDAARYPRPSIEDVELGFRLREAGYRIRLLPEVQVKHHKKWTLPGLLKTDICDRALPWAALGFQRGSLGRSLNLDWRGRLSGVASLGLAFSLPASVLSLQWAAAIGATSAGFLAAANVGFYTFLARCRGAGFALLALPLHWLYFIYSTAAYVWATGRHLARGPRMRGPAPEGQSLKGPPTAAKVGSGSGPEMAP